MATLPVFNDDVDQQDNPPHSFIPFVDSSAHLFGVDGLPVFPGGVALRQCVFDEIHQAIIHSTVASPYFSTLDEALEFGSIFGMTKANGFRPYDSCGCMSDDPVEHVKLLRFRNVLPRIKNLLPYYTGPDGLKDLAHTLGLDRYPLPCLQSSVDEED